MDATADVVPTHAAATHATADATEPTRQLGRVPALDGIRGIAVLIVVLSHTPLLVNSYEDKVFHVAFLDGFVTGGFIGVDMFFALSGFLITALALREHQHSGRIRLSAFYRRRALRLLPALFFLLAAHLVYTAIVHKSLSTERSTDVGAVFYFLNYKMSAAQSNVTTTMGHLWSLSVEEQFYFVWPLALVLMLSVKRFRRWIGPTIAALIVVIAAHRAYAYHSSHLWLRLVWRTDERADALLIGALAAWLWTRGHTPRRWAGALGWIALLALAVNVNRSHVSHSYPYYGGFTVYAICTVFIIFAVLDSHWTINRVLDNKVLGVVGRTSYGIYLWHVPIFWAVAEYAGTWTSLARVLAGYALTALATAFSYMVIERPALAWKTRLELRDRSRAARVSAVVGPAG